MEIIFPWQRTMNTRKLTKFNKEEVNRLAFLNWEKDGRPQGRDVDYWLEAESQLMATWHLLVKDLAPKTSRKTEVAKFKPGATSKMVFRPRAARHG